MNIGYRVRYGYEYQVQYGYRYVGKNGIPLQPKLQCNNKWSTVSPSHRHIQHHPAIVYPLCIRLSLVRIRPQAAVQIKKATLGRALTAQILFQGKLTPQPIIQSIVKSGMELKKPSILNECYPCRVSIASHQKPH